MPPVVVPPLEYVYTGQSVTSETGSGSTSVQMYRVKFDKHPADASRAEDARWIARDYVQAQVPDTPGFRRRLVAEYAGEPTFGVTNRNLWVVVRDELTSINTSGGVRIDIEDPLLRPPTAVWGGEPYEEEVFEDFSDPPKKIRNTAGSMFAEQPRAARKYMSLLYTRNRSVQQWRSVDLQLLGLDGEVVNNDTFVVDGVQFGPQQARLTIPPGGATRVVEQGTAYYQVTYQFLFRRDGWRPKYLSFGFVDKDGVRITDKTGQPVSVPWPLDNAGAKQPNETDDPAEVGPFRIYREYAFAQLGLT